MRYVIGPEWGCTIRLGIAIASGLIAFNTAFAAGTGDVVTGVFTLNNGIPNQPTEMEQRQLEMYRNHEENHGSNIEKISSCRSEASGWYHGNPLCLDKHIEGYCGNRP